MAKSKKPQTNSDDQITTVKVRKGTAQLIREIGTLQDINQEDVLDLFREQFESHVLKLLEQRTAAIKDRR